MNPYPAGQGTLSAAVLIVVAVVLLLILPAPWDIVGFAVALALSVVEVAFWYRRGRGRRHAVGADTLVGRDAVVLTACQPDGQVRIDGEIWAATCSPGAAPGDTVRIVDRRRLQLIVQPERVAPAAGPTAGSQRR